MKHFLGFIFLLFLTSCASNKLKTIEGKWQQEFLDYKSKVVDVHLAKSDAIMDVSRIKSRLKIEFDFNGEDTSYLTHSLHPYPAKFPPLMRAHGTL